ncbi:hypothetical protein GC197_03315 [bacterium]|nr:hypothetical protein [bacterium]
MKPSTLVVLAGLALVAYSLVSSTTDSPSPVNPGGPDLTSAFARSENPAQAADDARAFGCLCDAIADVIAFDGRQSEPQLTTGQQLDNFRKLSRFYQREGASYAERYPALAETAGNYLTDQLGTAGGKIDAADRDRWVSAYRALALSAHYAADRLR